MTLSRRACDSDSTKMTGAHNRSQLAAFHQRSLTNGSVHTLFPPANADTTSSAWRTSIGFGGSVNRLLATLQERSKWLLLDETAPRGHWLVGCILQTIHDKGSAYALFPSAPKNGICQWQNSVSYSPDNSFGQLMRAAPSMRALPIKCSVHFYRGSQPHPQTVFFTQGQQQYTCRRELRTVIILQVTQGLPDHVQSWTFFKTMPVNWLDSVANSLRECFKVFSAWMHVAACLLKKSNSCALRFAKGLKARSKLRPHFVWSLQNVHTVTNILK